MIVLDLRGLCDFTDYFVVCHGSSSRQVQAIAEEIEERVHRDAGRDPRHVEGRRQGEWVLLDYFDFVAHVFVDDKRSFFGLERLWGDAPRVDPLAPAGRAADRAARSTRRAPPARS